MKKPSKEKSAQKESTVKKEVTVKINTSFAKAVKIIATQKPKKKV